MIDNYLLKDVKFGIIRKIEESNIDGSLSEPDTKDSTLFFSPIGKIDLDDMGIFHLYTAKEEFSSIQMIQGMLSTPDSKEFEKSALKFHDLQEKTEYFLKETFPALELNQPQLISSVFPDYFNLPPQLSPIIDHFSFVQKQFLTSFSSYSRDVVEQLDYGIQITPHQTPDFLLMVPDAKTLEEKLQLLFNKEKINYSVKILKDPGILSDEKFIEAYLHYDIVISEGKEALHDHFIHAIPTATLMLENPPSYIEEKERIKNLIQNRIDTIKEKIHEKKISTEDASILWLALSYTIDLLWSSSTLNELRKIDSSFFHQEPKLFFQSNFSQKYLKNRFDHIDPKELKNLYEKVMKTYDLDACL